MYMHLLTYIINTTFSKISDFKTEIEVNLNNERESKNVAFHRFGNMVADTRSFGI